MKEFWKKLLDPQYRGRWAFFGAILVTLVGGGYAVYKQVAFIGGQRVLKPISENYILGDGQNHNRTLICPPGSEIHRIDKEGIAAQKGCYCQKYAGNKSSFIESWEDIEENGNVTFTCSCQLKTASGRKVVYAKCVEPKDRI